MFKQGRNMIRSALMIKQFLTQFISRIPNRKNTGLYLLLLQMSALRGVFGRLVWMICKYFLLQKRE